MKKLSFIRRTEERHWVGDGFPVRSLFSYNDLGQDISPFLLLDYAGPENFPPSNHRRGVGAHPHRGFETVTIVYSGEVEHRDSSGGGGTIGPGDVQWMTAASGLIHEEFHGTAFAQRGGPFEMVQLWVNLAAKDKTAPPAYQSISNTDIPQVELPSGAGVVRVIAGEYQDKRGPARTFSPMNVWDMRLTRGAREEFHVPAGWTTALVVLKGEVRFGTGEIAGPAELAVFARDEDAFEIEALKDATILVLNGKPLNEPIAGMGPFVMNTQAEIEQAMADYRSGRMGHLTARA
jgi:redox-sensitive bicupin YhaK (pirin superfamily)